ncbi:glycosyltransferase [Thermomonospora umbrina]|uniref:Glycosyltransferase involved in cell wall biosynthesis n=1 Tax=Thermomonospora umbrina TaxID=111806 RepID=A0A3D9ST99_9ACTN|nr:glycosyltransferase [Thermomonospora umbrina]REE97710.1 glycosyltransferase involved in cell wall biosynthesis [Thermomonospora umbrina]
MRVLHVITGLGHGGAEHQLDLLLRHLPDVDCEVAVLTDAGETATALRARGVIVHEVGMNGNRDLSALPRLTGLIRRGGYDIVHTHLYRACVYGRIAARLAGVRTVVATEHSLGDRMIEGRRVSAGVRTLYRATEILGGMTVAVSPTVAARLVRLGVDASRVTVIPNGIDANAFAYDEGRRAAVRRRLGIGMDEYVIGAVGRLVDGKRYGTLVDAFSQVDAVKLLIVGDGPQRGALEDLTVRRGVAPRVIFAGERSDVAGELSAMDVLAAPSAEETFGLAVLEGLASGLPVLYTACPALGDLDPDAAPGAREVGPQVSAWRDALADVVRTGPTRTAPPPAVHHYDIARSAADLARLYEALLAVHAEPALA